MRTTQPFAFIISYNWGSGRNGKEKKNHHTPPTHIKLFTSADNNNELIISCSI